MDAMQYTLGLVLKAVDIEPTINNSLRICDLVYSAKRVYGFNLISDGLVDYREGDEHAHIKHQHESSPCPSVGLLDDLRAIRDNPSQLVNSDIDRKSAIKLRILKLRLEREGLVKVLADAV